MKLFSQLVVLVLLVALVAPPADACGRRCSNADPLEQAQTRLETAVNDYYVSMLADQYGMNAAEVNTSLANVRTMAQGVLDRSFFSYISEWEADIWIKLFALRHADHRFENGDPIQIRSHLNAYRLAKAEAGPN